MRLGHMGIVGKYFGIIGILVVAVIIALVKVMGQDKAGGAMKRIFGALRGGGVDAARAEIDKLFAPGRSPPLAAWFAALALIGDRAMPAREVAAADGKLRNIAYQKAYGLLGLVLAGDPSASQQLADHAALCDRELSRVMGKIKDAIRDLAVIGAALAGGTSDPMRKVRAGLLPFHTEWTRGLVWECVARAFERDGK